MKKHVSLFYFLILCAPVAQAAQKSMSRSASPGAEGDNTLSSTSTPQISPALQKYRDELVKMIAAANMSADSAHVLQNQNIAEHSDSSEFSQAIASNSNAHLSHLNRLLDPIPGSLDQFSNQLSQVPVPQADTIVIDAQLIQSTLKHAPDEIKTIVRNIKLYIEQSKKHSHDDEIVKTTENTSSDAKKTDQKKFPLRLLLHGAPGLGKTTLAEAMAAECGIAFYGYKASDISNPFSDSGSLNIRRIFTQAIESEKPCIIFIDELAVLFDRYNDKANPDKTTLPQLWRYLDDCKKYKYPILFIGATNSIENAPETIISRFENSTIKMPLPGEEQRKDLITYYMNKHQASFEDKENLITELAINTNSFSHRNIEDLIDSIVENRKNIELATITKEECLNALQKALSTRNSFKGSSGEKVRSFAERWGGTMGMTASVASVLNIGLVLYLARHNEAKALARQNQLWWWDSARYAASPFVTHAITEIIKNPKGVIDFILQWLPF